ELELAHRFEQVDLPLGVDREGVDGRDPRRRHEALRGEVEDVVGLRLLERPAHRGEIAQVGLDQVDLALEVLDVVGPAPPAVEAEDLDVGMLGEQVVGEVRAGETGDASDQGLHETSSSKNPAAPESRSYAAASPTSRIRPR